MDNPIDSILNTYPPDFFRSLEEWTNAAFMKAHHLTCEHYAEPEQVNMLGQARHACCEEEFRAAALDAGLAARVLHTRPPGGRYSLVSCGGIHLIRCNVQAHCGTPRPTRFRNAWAALNAWLDPIQLDLLRAVPRPPSGQLCGMIVVTAHKRYGDPSVPAFIGLGVPRSDLSNWVVLEPIQRMLGLYHDLETTRHTPPEAPVEVKDRAVPRLRRSPDGSSTLGTGREATCAAVHPDSEASDSCRLGIPEASPRWRLPNGSTGPVPASRAGRAAHSPRSRRH